MGNVFPFEKLAAELRVHIYEDLCVAATPIEIRHIPRPPYESPPTRSKGFINQGVAKGSTRNYPLLRGIDATHILHLSKAILAEALPVLYGKNTFTFFFEPDLRKFVQSIGANAQHLRHITPSLDSTTEVATTQPIRLTPRVKTITFCVLPNGFSLACLQDVLWKCVRDLVLQVDGEEARRRRLDAIRIAVWKDDFRMGSSSKTHRNEAVVLDEMEELLEDEGVLVRRDE